MEGKKEAYRLREVRVRLEEGAGLYSERKIENADDAVLVMQRELATYDREVVCIVNLNSAGRPICFNLVSMGNINTSILDIVNVLKCCILTNTASFVMLHNHPSGDVSSPSQADLDATKGMVLAGALMGIPCLDHVIIAAGGKEKYSMKEHYDVDFNPGYEKVAKGVSGMVAEAAESYADPFGDGFPPMPAPEPEPEPDGAAEKGEEVTLHFGKGLCQFFTSKKGAEMARIKLSNTPFDSWPSFVVPAKLVHINRFGKGLWMKLPANAKTTLTISRKVTLEDGTQSWQDKKIPVDNVQLKEMVESYKKKGREDESPPLNTQERAALSRAR